MDDQDQTTTATPTPETPTVASAALDSIAQDAPAPPDATTKLLRSCERLARKVCPAEWAQPLEIETDEGIVYVTVKGEGYCGQGPDLYSALLSLRAALRRGATERVTELLLAVREDG